MSQTELPEPAEVPDADPEAEPDPSPDQGDYPAPGGPPEGDDRRAPAERRG